MKAVLDFIFSALPYLSAGYIIARIAVNFGNRKRGKKLLDWSGEGLCLGVAMGAALGGVMEKVAGYNRGRSILVFMALGTLLGSFIPKKNTEDEKKPAETGANNDEADSEK